MIYQNKLVVQQADFEKIKSEYDVTILFIAGNCIGHCHYLYDFILCILALHGFASKITTICFNSESVTANKNLLNVCSCWEVRLIVVRQAGLPNFKSKCCHATC